MLSSPATGVTRGLLNSPCILPHCTFIASSRSPNASISFTPVKLRLSVPSFGSHSTSTRAISRFACCGGFSIPCSLLVPVEGFFCYRDALVVFERSYKSSRARENAGQISYYQFDEFGAHWILYLSFVQSRGARRLCTELYRGFTCRGTQR